MTGGWLVLLESNTTGSGRLFCTAGRRFDLRPVVFTRDPDRYPYLAEDRIEVRRLDTSDRQAVRAAMAGLPGKVAGVTSSSEYFVAAAAELAAELDRPHPDPGAVAACRDKGIQRRLLHDGGLVGPAFAVATDPGQAADRARELGLPVVLKPASGSGSVGVRLCTGTAEVTEAAEAVLAGLAGIPSQCALLVEQYLDGPEFSVETFGIQVVGITAKHVGAAPYFIETGHDFPASLSAATRAALAEAAVQAVNAVGLGWGPAHVELRLTAAGPAVVEVNPRLAGGMIPDLVRLATGVDLVAATVAAVAGLPVELDPDRDAGAAIRFLVAERSGRFAGAAGLERAAACPQVTGAVLTGRVGGLVAIEHSFRDRLGYLIATGRDGRDAGTAADRALAHVRLRIEDVRQPALLDRH